VGDHPVKRFEPSRFAHFGKFLDVAPTIDFRPPINPCPMLGLRTTIPRTTPRYCEITPISISFPVVTIICLVKS
jgi:hypothetical protein